MTRGAVSLWRDATLAATFFTRLPIPVPVGPQRALAGTLWAAPLAGWLVGAVGAAVLLAGSQFGVPPLAAASAALAATVIVTGALHEDGLSDTVDGFWGGRDRVRRLEIMRDSRIGSYGAAALGLSLLLRWSVLASLAPANAALALVVAHGASRALLPAHLRALPPARDEGLSAGSGRVTRLTAGVALALGLLPLTAFGLFGLGATTAGLAALFLLFGDLCRRRIGGQTGDTAGALQQGAEILVLICAATVLT